MIEKQQATVWLAPTKGRRYFTRKAAIKAEARALIFKKYPKEENHDEFRSWIDYDIEQAEPERYEKMHRRMCRILERALPKRVTL